ncbi:TetR/AcrR family transcriptional regulator [Paenibacillus sp. FSL R7-0048]|uniref:TetR/AcrR family transcriptional regulator n=1 Tax=Paenibacillus TaxID=44249 RepID=UPI00096D6F53|nr:TetR/AcrR family transcriptional regulator [Paenibacillus odorifer]OMD70161.1 hypothetical protein BSK48_16165 [Paenibacillus odorifer]OMD83625.1 hypothetical protein BSK53_12620 [Paenibacillus odorifer]
MTIKVKNIRKTGTRQAIIEAFLAIASKKSIEKITILEISERANVNRATFYAHFLDKYEVLDEVIGESAAQMVQLHTKDVYLFNKEKINQLVYAVFEYYEQINNTCKGNYESKIPQLRSRMIDTLRSHLEKCLANIYEQEDRTFYARIYAALSYEAGYLWATDQTGLLLGEAAEKVADLIMGGLPNV